MFVDQGITRFDDAKNSQRAMVKRGNVFTAQKSLFSIPSTSSLSTLIEIKSSIVSLEGLIIKTNATSTTVELFRDTAFTPSGAITPFNRNDISTRTFSGSVFNGSSTSDGVLVLSGVIIGPEVKANEVAVVEDSVVIAFVMRPNTNYSLKITNNDAATSNYIIDMTLVDNQ